MKNQLKFHSSKLETLEALRGFAALYVVFHHMTMKENNIWSYIFSEGQAAVILFFVLSGFVIYYSSQKITVGKLDFSDYFIKRFRRIYPLFIAALLVSYIARSIHLHSAQPLDGTTLAGNLLNLQDIKRIPNNWFSPYYGNIPLWSLSYEWWFYILFFPIFKYVKEKYQYTLALSISVFGYLSFMAYNNKISITLEYFFIWWSGVELARAWMSGGKISSRAYLHILFGYALMILLCGTAVFFYKGKLNFEKHPLIELRHFFYGIILISIGLLWKTKSFIGYKYVLKPFLLFSSISYGLYVFHVPLISSNDNLFSDNTALNNLIGFTVTLVLAYIFEVPVQKSVNNITNRFLKKSTPKSIVSIDDDNKLLPG